MPPRRKGEKLTPKEKRFAKEYAVDLNGEKAAKRAGYSPKSAKVIASINLTRPNVAEEVNKNLEKVAKKTEITAEYVLNGFKEIHERCVQAIPVMKFNYKTKQEEQVTEMVTHEDGTVTEEGVWRFDSAGANTALTKLGDHLGLFKVNLNHSNDKDNPLFLPIQIIKPPKK